MIGPHPVLGCLDGNPKTSPSRDGRGNDRLIVELTIFGRPPQPYTPLLPLGEGGVSNCLESHAEIYSGFQGF
jgi:hypothetical protein